MAGSDPLLLAVTDDEIAASIRHTELMPKFSKAKNEKTRIKESQNSSVAFGPGLGDSGLRISDVSDTVQPGQSDQLDDEQIETIEELPHVQESVADDESATCGNLPATLTDSLHLTGKDLTKWALGNFTVDPVKNSKNRWRIRVRCRKVGCAHQAHIGLLTVSFMSDSAFRQAIRGSKKYEQWKKQILAENARALRKGN